MLNKHRLIFLWRLILHKLNFFSLSLNNSIDIDEDGHYLIATKKGLFQLLSKKLTCVFEGEWYGITNFNNKVWAFTKLSASAGKIVEFDISNQNAIKFTKELNLDLSGGCHQIDWYENALHITDTYNNQIIRYDLEELTITNYSPIGVLKEGRNSSNYGHINSIYILDKQVYVLCHNETTKTGKSSEILKLDKNFKLQEIIQTSSGNAHNVLASDIGIFHCDSASNSLKLNDQVVLQSDMFTRGLSFSKNSIVLGGSEYANRSDRNKAKGKITFTDSSFNNERTYPMPSMVQEIRRLDCVDYSLSRNAVV